MEGEPLGFFVGADCCPTMLQHRAESLQEQSELCGRRTQPDGTAEIVIPDQTELLNPSLIQLQALPEVPADS